MDWLANLVKHVTVSRSLTGAALITSAVLIFGPKLYPATVDAVPVGWNWAPIAIFFFSASLTTFWVTAGLWKLASHVARGLAKVLPLAKPSQEEEMLLRVLADCADDSLNLDELHYRTQRRIPKLILLDLSKRLCKKRYVRENQFDENLISLTDEGRAYALGLLARRED